MDSYARCREGRREGGRTNQGGTSGNRGVDGEEKIRTEKAKKGMENENKWIKYVEGENKEGSRRPNEGFKEEQERRHVGE